MRVKSLISATALAWVAATAALLCFSGCATTIPVTVMKPAEVNMAATRKVAVLDFAVTRFSVSYKTEDLLKRALEKLLGLERRETTLEERVSRYATERMILTLIDTGYFQVVSPREAREVLKGQRGQNVDVALVGRTTGAQAVIGGEISRMETEDEESVTKEEVKNPETGEKTEVTHTWLTRTATLGLEYFVINTESNVIIATRSFENSLQEKREIVASDAVREIFPPEMDMYEAIIDSFMPEISRQLAPYTVKESRALMKDESKSGEMEEAARLAKSGVYDDALAIYLDVWKRKKNPSAGYNGAILHEVMGNIDAAVALMKQVVGVSDKERVAREYRRLLAVKEERRRLEAQLAGGV